MWWGKRAYFGASQDSNSACRYGGRRISSSEHGSRMQEHLRQSGVPFACVRTAGFYGNYLSPMLFYMKQPDGSFVWSNNCGDDKHPWHAAEDIGQTTAGTA